MLLEQLLRSAVLLPFTFLERFFMKVFVLRYMLAILFQHSLCVRVPTSVCRTFETVFQRFRISRVALVLVPEDAALQNNFMNAKKGVSEWQNAF
ncbi:hypothetical protein ACA30_13945 [Virgibacillus soli]|nr:hypothetical protein ACA30_13945 [Virgibacillus soli]